MSQQLILSFLSGVFISSIAGYLGTLMLSRKMSVVAGPLAHLALPGVALALLFNWSLFVGTFPFVLLGVILIWFLNRKTLLPMENLAAIIFAFGVGTALLILPIGKAEEALVGSINNISLKETIFVITIASLVFLSVSRIYNKLMLINIYEDLVRVRDSNVSRYEFLYLLNIGLTVSLGVYLVGGLITAALIALPAAIAQNLSSDLKKYQIISIVAANLAMILGILINYFTHLPTGPLIIISGVGLFILSLLGKLLNKQFI